MTIKGKRKRKIVIKSIFCLILSLSIFLSSFGICFARSEGSPTTPDDLIDNTGTILPSSNPFYGPQVTRDNLNRLYDDTSRVALMVRKPYYNGDNLFHQLTTVTSYDELVFVPAGLNITMGVYSRSSHDAIVVNSYTYSSGSPAQTYWCSNVPVSLPGIEGNWYICDNATLANLFQNLDGDFYCNADFLIYGSDFLVHENLDISAYIPDPHYFSVQYVDDSEYIYVDVNFDPHIYSSFVTVWGYNEYGGILYIYNSSEYQYIIESEVPDVQDTWRFLLDVNAIKSSYVGTDFHISSISCMGWDDAFEKTLSVDWNFSSEKVPTNYDPPNEYYYYSNFYNENYSYNDDNGNAVAFGYTTLYASNDLTVPCIWDSDNTLIEPYKFSYIAIPHYSIPSHYLDYILPSLSLSYDVIILDCNIDVWCTIYDETSIQPFTSYLDFSNNDTFSETFNSWYLSHPPGREPLPYSLKNDKPTYTYSGNAGILYTYSYFYKSMLYLFGDTNQYLLEIETRLFEENGAFNELNKSLAKIYENDYSYYTDMLTYMDKLDYLVFQLVSNDYFSKYLTHLISIDNKLGDIANALTGTNEEDFDNELHAPWLQIYRYFKTLFNRSLANFPDFLDTTSEILDGGSDQVGIGFTLDNDYEQYLPLNSPSVSPTPIPIPTLFP